MLRLISKYRITCTIPKTLILPSKSYTTSVFAPLDTFARRHIGPSDTEISTMCKTVGVTNLSGLVDLTLPASIRLQTKTELGAALAETEVLEKVRKVASLNKVYKSYIGSGYYDTITPPVILRNIMENPSWYTQYTPYQPEISQGRLESLLNYQTMVSSLTGLPIANASLLDEGTAAAEAMMVAFSNANRKKKTFFIDQQVNAQTIACVGTRAQGFDIKVVVGDYEAFDFNGEGIRDDVMGVLVQYPNSEGQVLSYEKFFQKAHDHKALTVCATDLMALALLKPPGEFGADMAFGNSQRFGVPLGYGGPHAAFFAISEAHKRRIPGRLIGVSKDANGKLAYRLALQTREQHIRREKAISNICTAQALLANMAAMYAVYHGPQGIKNIATKINILTSILRKSLVKLGFAVKTTEFFDTLTISFKDSNQAITVLKKAQKSGINFRYSGDNLISISLDETVTKSDLIKIISIFSSPDKTIDVDEVAKGSTTTFQSGLARTSPYLQHPIFNSHHSETEMLRYIMELANKDLSLSNAMIPLGSCTMKLNATTEMIPITWKEFGGIHPFVPIDQSLGYQEMFKDLRYRIGQITGFDSVSLQPNSGAQGEFAGLKVIKSYLSSIGQAERDICLIPVSAHGTNPASASLAGLKVVTVKCLENGNLDLNDLRAKSIKYKDTLAATMITYPSTYGVFEDGIKEACKIVHENGGQVYMDGANLNAQLGLCTPGEIGADVCHLNLHKTFCIPHGGGGPGMGPIGVKSHLAPHLPSHPIIPCNAGDNGIGPISAAPWGSASILPISWVYLLMMGDNGLRKATEVALLNANYMMKRLAPHYQILYTNKKGMCAHEFILDMRPFEKEGIEVIDIAKRILDYGFHAPTMSFPVVGTLMIEPTESESKDELDRFCDSMISIRKEIQQVIDGKVDREVNVLKMAPHCLSVLMADKWDRGYSREQAAYPLPFLRQKKFWPTISRIDDTFGDRNLICECPPIESYQGE